MSAVTCAYIWRTLFLIRATIPRSLCAVIAYIFHRLVHNALMMAEDVHVKVSVSNKGETEKEKRNIQC